MHKKIVSYSMILLLFTILTCTNQSIQNNHANQRKGVETEELVEDASSDALLAINASQYGIKYRETQILMQNRRGIRIEYTLDRASLQLWISPQAGISMSYVDQNWSNRDDHTHVLDRILIPGCDLTQFVRCDWDPFHSIIYFKKQILHIAQIYDRPAVLIWFEKDGLVDFKINGTEVERTDNTFIINFTDRGRDFQSAAVLSPGEGYFQQQLQLDKYRSIHTRAHLKAGQVLLIASELKKESIGEKAKQWVKTPVKSILSANEEKIAADLAYGRFTLNNRPEMQKLLDKSRRVALSMQTYKGFMRSTNQYIYYLLWYRDGGMNTSHITYTGWPQPAFDHTKFALHNPNFTNEHPDSIFFGQVMGGPLTKWQEDGLFYVVWPAFSYWTQSGDKILCEGKYLETMERALAWLEARCFDEKKGLFGRYFACETPMSGSRDDGWDNVTGAPTFKWDSKYKGKTIVRSYDLYVNLLHYSTYLMMSAMQEDEAKAEALYRKAMNLEKNINIFFDYDDVLPSYGELQTETGDFITAEPYGMDIWDYVWGLSLPPFEPTRPEKYRNLREQLREDMMTTEKGYFLCVYFALLTSMDTEIHDEDKITAAMDQLVEYSIKPGKYLPMPYAMPEMFNISEENPYHDVRPLVYSIAPWLSAVTNLGIHRLPFGIAARGTRYLENLSNYEYKDALINVRFKGTGETVKLLLNGEELQSTLQLPEDRLIKGENTLIVKMEEKPLSPNQLVASTVQLISAVEADKPEFKIKAYGKNVLTFKNLMGSVMVRNLEGNPTEYERMELDPFTYVEFPGRGEFLISIGL